jgi:hypothetical protein
MIFPAAPLELRLLAGISPRVIFVWRFAPGEPPTRLRKIGLVTQEFARAGSSGKAAPPNKIFVSFRVVRG